MIKILCFLLLLSSVALYGQNPIQHKVDSLMQIAQTTSSDTIRAGVYYKIGIAYWGNNNEKTLEYVNKAFDLYKKAGHLKGQGKSMDAISGVYYALGQYE